jgi:hypothetical protein
MNKTEHFHQREPSRTSFWAGVLLLALVGITIFGVFKLVASMIGV